MGALELIRLTLPIDRETGDRRSEAGTLGNLGVAWLALGDLTQARRDLEEGLRLMRANGDRATQSGPALHLSQIALWQRDFPRALALARSGLELSVAAEAREFEALALLFLGEAELASGRFDAAAQACERARIRALEIGDPVQHDAVAGLARVALAQDDITSALRQVEVLLAHLDSGGTLEGSDASLLILLTNYEVLARAGDARAPGCLEHAHAALQAKAAQISDAQLRRGFLTNIPHHRAIVAAWQTQNAAKAGPRAAG